MLKSLVVLMISVVTVLSQAQKMFRPMTGPGNTAICAVDQPSKVLTAVELQASLQEQLFAMAMPRDASIPLTVVCARLCTAELACYDFALRSDVQQCEMYFCRPINYTAQPYCIHYTVCTDSVTSMNYSKISAHW